MMGSDLSVPSAVPAPDLHREKFRLDACSLSDRALGQHVQINLDAVRDEPVELSDAQPDDTDLLRMLLFCFPDAVVQEMFCNTEFVQDSILQEID